MKSNKLVTKLKNTHPKRDEFLKNINRKIKHLVDPNDHIIEMITVIKTKNDEISVATQDLIAVSLSTTIGLMEMAKYSYLQDSHFESDPEDDNPEEVS